jgi:hypothetical protein
MSKRKSECDIDNRPRKFYKLLDNCPALSNMLDMDTNINNISYYPYIYNFIKIPTNSNRIIFCIIKSVSKD